MININCDLLFCSIFFVIIFLFIFKWGIFDDFKKPCALFTLSYIVFIVIGNFIFFIFNRELLNQKVIKLAFIGLTFYLIGYKFYVNTSGKIKDKHKNEIWRYNRSMWLFLLYLYLIIFGFAGLLLFYYQAGGIILFNKEMLENRSVILQGRGFGLQLFRFTVIPLYLLFAESVVNSWNLFKKLFIYILVFLIIFGLASTGFRSPIVEIFLTLILIKYTIIKKKITLKKAMVVFGSLLFVIILFGIYRESSNFIKIAALSTYVNLLNLTYIIDTFPEKVPFQYGKTYFMNFLMIRPGPDIDFTIWLREQLNLSHFVGGATPSIIGEWYLNFGYLGIPVGMLIMGIFSGWLTRKILSAQNIFEIIQWNMISVALIKTITGGISNVILFLTLNLIVLKICKLSAKIKFPMRIKK